MYQEIIKRIESGPAVLLIGQNYLSMETGEDQFIKMIGRKYNSYNDSDLDYKSILTWKIDEKTADVVSWMYKLSRSIAIPEWLDSISKISWASVYTSSFDTVLNRVFASEWRSIQPIYDDKFRLTDSRDRLNLHITYLMGGVEEIDINKRPPLTQGEFFRRKTVINTLLNRLPSVITPKGVLIIDGYNLNDQLSLEDLAPILYNLGSGQALLCSCKDLVDNEIIQGLIESGKLLVSEKKFSELLLEWTFNNEIKIFKPTDYEYFGKWLTLTDRRLNIPSEIFNAISQTASILDDDIFDDQIEEKDDVEDFRRFLSSSNAKPAWFGYPKNFAFKKEAYAELKKNVLTRVKRNDFKDIPLILHGQSSSGKTTLLGLLAYELRNEFKYPVLFIEKRYQKVEEREIDKFILWLESNGAKQTFIIWDGMNDRTLYNGLLKKLNTRGRNVILIGSCYTTQDILESSDKSHLIESPIELSNNEKRLFENFIRDFNPILSNILASINESNFLAMLYRYIPEVQGKINMGLANEYEFFTGLLTNSKISRDIKEGQLYDAMIKAGIPIDHNLIDLAYATEVGNELLTLADQLVFSIMVPGKFGLNVPFELLLQIIGFDAFSSSLFKALNEVNIIKWYEFSQGELLLGPRTTLEAQILSGYLGNRDSEAAVIKLLLRNIRPNQGVSDEPDYQIQFAVELLNKIGPNSGSNMYKSYYYDFADELKELRESGHTHHPRLILKEAFFLRELVKSDTVASLEEKLKLLDRAVEIVENILEELQNYPERSIKMYLRVELASLLGTKAVQYAKNGNGTLAKKTFDQIRLMITASFASNPENYGALDVIGWATLDLIKEDVFDEEEKLNVESDLAYLLESAELEGVSEQNQNDFDNLKLKFNDLIQNHKIADSIFERLRESGNASGYYIRAKNILGFLNIGNEFFYEKNKEIFEYLSEHFTDIKNDNKCLFLLFRSWWFIKTKSMFFSKEKQTLPLSESDWEYCLNILNRMEAIGINFSATIYYLKAIAEFHLEMYPESTQTFSMLDSETNYSFYGKRRVQKFYLSSNPDGTPKSYSGQVRRSVAANMNDKRGNIYIPELRQVIPFLLNDFRKSSYQDGERISSLYISFNFRGPIAVEV